jgi:hypothetical protein
VDSAGSRYGPVGGCYEHDSENSASVSAIEFCFSFFNCQFLKKKCYSVQLFESYVVYRLTACESRHR